MASRNSPAVPTNFPINLFAILEFVLRLLGVIVQFGYISPFEDSGSEVESIEGLPIYLGNLRHFNVFHG